MFEEKNRTLTIKIYSIFKVENERQKLKLIEKSRNYKLNFGLRTLDLLQVKSNSKQYFQKRPSTHADTFTRIFNKPNELDILFLKNDKYCFC